MTHDHARMRTLACTRTTVTCAWRPHLIRWQQAPPAQDYARMFHLPHLSRTAFEQRKRRLPPLLRALAFAQLLPRGLCACLRVLHACACVRLCLRVCLRSCMSVVESVRLRS
eukprot:2410810-Pleurochrysis_carterae.AAC.1